jgi:uncharacterized damage-inducible protein DinB
MTVRDLQRLFDYGYWANRALFAKVAQLPAEKFVEAVAGGHGSIRNTLVHAMSAEWGWIDRCGGTPRGPALDPAAYPTPASVVETWGRVEGFVRSYLSGLRDQDLPRIVEFSLGSGAKRALPVGELLQHAANHGIHHRGQIALLLRMLGIAPGNFDLLIYDGERREPGA